MKRPNLGIAKVLFEAVPPGRDLQCAVAPIGCTPTTRQQHRFDQFGVGQRDASDV
ncbi:MAG: hypothetical protein WKF78_14915 [Candidatus Limnocylindrales bacterium]